MADLNNNLDGLQKRSHKVREELKNLLMDYEGLFREVNGIYLNEKMSSSNDDLSDFYHLLQTIRRNRDVMGSLMKGFASLRPMDKFRFVEEDVPEVRPKKEKKKEHVSEDVPGLEDLMVEKEPAHA